MQKRLNLGQYFGWLPLALQSYTLHRTVLSLFARFRAPAWLVSMASRGAAAHRLGTDLRKPFCATYVECEARTLLPEMLALCLRMMLWSGVWGRGKSVAHTPVCAGEGTCHRPGSSRSSSDAASPHTNCQLVLPAKLGAKERSLQVVCVLAVPS